MARWPGAVALVVLGSTPVGADTLLVGSPAADARGPRSYLSPAADATARVHRGEEVFTTQWVAAGTPGAAGRSGLGPLFNAASCDSCHRSGAHGDGPAGDGPAPIALVVKLEAPSSDDCADPPGDPVYGRVFNTVAQYGVPAEGVVSVRYREITGTYYPGGTQWTVRDPRYSLELQYGPLAPTTIIKPRIAPALYGLGLLEAVPATAILGEPAGTGGRLSGDPAVRVCHGARLVGRFGWQGNAVSVRNQTANAFVREMGLTSSLAPADDCTPAQVDCRRVPAGGSPEVPDEPFDAVVAFAQSVAVPEPRTHADADDPGPRIFAALGCDGCHAPRLPVELPQADGTQSVKTISAYTDLRLHDLGGGMADRTAAGRAVESKWRTTPLWGLGFRVTTENHPTFLHDGRARTTEEAILWHLGEGARSQRRFKELLPGQRAALLHWLETL